MGTAFLPTVSTVSPDLIPGLCSAVADNDLPFSLFRQRAAKGLKWTVHLALEPGYGDGAPYPLRIRIPSTNPSQPGLYTVPFRRIIFKIPASEGQGNRSPQQTVTEIRTGKGTYHGDSARLSYFAPAR